ncbi:MAG TPA: hypothetical protein PKI17_05625, partial [Syntrophomonas sp.]|nr:hypothetical protein [Syntrophomonas sp.]
MAMKKIEWMKGSWKKLLKEYLLTILSTAIIGAVCYPFTEIIGYQTVGLLFLMSISILSIFLDRGPVLFTAILSFFVWN